MRLGFSVATEPVMPGMTAPMEALWHIYQRTWPVLQVMGGRGSGKTRGLSLVEAAKAKFYPGYSIAHVGATKAQAHRCYSYFREYVAPGGGLAGDVAKTRLSDTSWRNGSHMEVLPGHRERRLGRPPGADVDRRVRPARPAGLPAGDRDAAVERRGRLPLADRAHLGALPLERRDANAAQLGAAAGDAALDRDRRDGALRRAAGAPRLPRRDRAPRRSADREPGALRALGHLSGPGAVRDRPQGARGRDSPSSTSRTISPGERNT